MSGPQRIDPESVRAHKPIATVVGQYIKLVRDGQEFRAPCPFHNEKTPSFYVIPAKKFAHCFGCGWHGDSIDFVMKYLSLGFRQACAVIAGENVAPLPAGRRQPDPEHEPEPDIYDDFKPIVPVPDDVPPLLPGVWTPKILNIKRIDDPTVEVKEKGWKPTHVHPYRAADGSLIGYVLRSEWTEGKKRAKLTPQVMWCERPDGGRQWCLRKFSEPRPIYGLDLLAANPDADALVLEGEKKTDHVRAAWADQLLLPFVPVSPVGGTGGIGKCDWAPLAGRRVVIWPDADGPGAKAALHLAAILLALGCNVWIIDTTGLPAGYDAAGVGRPGDDDYAAPPADLEAFIAERAKPYQLPAPDDDEPPIAEPHDGDWMPDHGLSDEDAVRPGVASYSELEAQVGLLQESTRPNVIDALAREIARADLGPVQEEKLMRLVKERTGTSSSALNRIAKTVRKAMEAEQRRDEKAAADVRRRYVFIKAVNGFWDRAVGTFVSVDGLRNYHVGDMPMAEDGQRVNPIVYLLHEEKGCDKVDEVTFDPGRDEILVDRGVRRLNCWRPTETPMREGDASPWERHIVNVCDGNERATEHLMDYLAHMVQRPGIKIRSTILLIGKPGAGKSMIGDTMTLILGEHNVATVEQSQLRSQFNSWMHAKQAAIVNELAAFSAPDVMTRLLGYITDTRLTINPKNVAEFTYPNRVNFLMFSNKEKAVGIDPGDRRYFIWKSRFDAEADYYEQLHRWRDHEGGLAIIHHYLATRDISSFNPMAHAPMTDAKAHIQRLSVDSLQAYVEEAIDSRSAPFASDLINLNMASDYLAKTQRMKATTQMLAAVLSNLGHTDLQQQRVGGERRRLWCIRNADTWRHKGEGDYSRYLDSIGYFGPSGGDLDFDGRNE